MIKQIIQFPRQLELPLVWHEIDWTHYDISTVRRPVENIALENIREAAKGWRKTSGSLGFDAAMWRVYFADLELRFRWENAIILPSEIAKKAGLTASHVNQCLWNLDDVCIAREKLNISIIPPIPQRHKLRDKELKRLMRLKDIRRVA